MILNFSPEFLQKILDGSKRITLRKGIRKIKAGPCILKAEGVELRALIERADYLRFSELGKEHVKYEGLDSIEELRGLLKRFYPGIEGKSWITAIYFKLEKEVKDGNSETIQRRPR